MRARSLFLASVTFVLSYPLIFIDRQLKRITGFEGFGHLLKETKELWLSRHKSKFMNPETASAR